MNFDRSLLFSWIEEDNIQRAYFRVRPLLTLDGDIREESAQLWPNEGCLRIVPDRNEQHTFKTRMRTLGNFCVVDLRGQPVDAGKIRTNKNFRPEKGEVNQYILYSDTVHPLPENTFYQIVDGTAENYAAAAEKAVTPCFFIRQEDTLYGPVRKEAPALPETAKEAAGMLFELPCPDGVTRMVLCIDDTPAAAVQAAENREEKPAAPAEPAPAAETAPAAEAAPAADNAPAVQEAPEATEASPAQEAPETAKEPGEQDAPAVQEPAAETSLPIGKPLKILDETKDFAQTIQHLDKPLSKDANLLRQPEKLTKPVHSPKAADMPAIKPSDLSGTPLIRTPLRTSPQQPKNKVQEVVANQLLVGKYEPPTGNLPSGIPMRSVTNPVEQACSMLRTAWHSTDARPQLTDFILSLEGVYSQLEPRLKAGKGVSVLQRVLRDKLQDLEAERLTALCELDRAKRDVDAYKAELTEGIAARIRRETSQLESDRSACQTQVDALKNEINHLQVQRDTLMNRIEELQSSVLPETVARLIADAHMVAPGGGAALRMTPAAGVTVEADALIDRLMAACEASGVTITRNHAVALLVLLALSPRIGFSCATVAPLATLMHNVARAMGWDEGFAHQISPEQKPVASLPPVDAAPALLMTSLPNYAPLQSITKLLLARNTAGLVRNAAYDACQWPVVTVPQLPFVPKLDEIACESRISKNSLAALLDKQGAADAEIAAVLTPVLNAAPPLSGAAQKEMFRFVSVCTALMEGGLAVAADWALMLWVIPSVDRNARCYASFKAQLDEYPLSLAAL